MAALSRRIRNVLAGLALAAALAPAAAAPPPGLVPIDLVWSAHPVRFGLATTEDVIVVAY